VKSVIEGLFTRKKLSTKGRLMRILQSIYNLFFGHNFNLKQLANGRYIFLYRKGRFADWVALDMNSPQYSWKEGSPHFADCMFNLKTEEDVKKLKYAVSYKFALTAEEFEELIFTLIKEDIVNEDCPRG
jgi:hypothetical protein